MSRLPATERYRNDPAFRHIVDMMQSLIHNADYTPSEIREAAMLAQILYEETHLRPRFIEAVHSGAIRPRTADGWK